MAPRDGDAVEELLKNADLAVYRAKQEGRGCARFFAPEMQTLARASVLLEIDLRAAIDRQEFVICYQPVVEGRTGRIVGAEALLRWNRPGHGMVMPGAFLDLAEDSGLIVPINRWVVQQACRQAAAWAQAGIPTRVGVNLSSALFKAGSVKQLVLAALEESGLPPHLLELELTETTLLDNQREVANELHTLRRLGVRIAVDDFGTGYSSLAYLQILPIDRLKIDRSFVQDLDTNADRAAIVDAVVGIGRSLRLEVLAEGVETETQLERVLSAGCEIVQGFYFSRAMPAEQFGVLAAQDVDFPWSPAP
jgi:predicted signal transduction protein with EAL and GGDEF domain